MRTFTQFVGISLLVVVAVIFALYLPEPLMRDGVKWAHRVVFSGGIFSATLFKIIEYIKGDTKKLIDRRSLRDLQKQKLSNAIHRRSRFLWNRYLIVLAITAISYGCSYFSTKGYSPHLLLRISFLLVWVALWSIIPVLQAGRDYVKAKELLDSRDCGVPDIE